MKPKRVYRSTPRTAAEVENDNAIRKKYAHRPSLESLVASGEYSQPIKQTELWTLLEMAHAIKRNRLRLKMSLADLSRESGIDQAALSRLENGQLENPTYRTLERVAQALGLRLRLALVEAKK